MTKGFQDSVLDLKTHSYWSLLFKVALGVKKSCYKAILLNVYLQPKMFFCIAYILHSASWLESTTCKRLQGDVSNSTKNRQRQTFWEPRPGGHLDAGQRGAAAHGTVSIACSSPLVLRPLRTWRWIKEHLPLNLQTSESLSPKDLFPILTSALTDNSNDQLFGAF